MDGRIVNIADETPLTIYEIAHIEAIGARRPRQRVMSGPRTKSAICTIR
jgi:hypothetical protein